MFGNGYDQGWYRYFHYSIRHNIDIRCWIFIFEKADLLILLFNPFSYHYFKYIIYVYLWKTGIAARRVPTQYTLLYYINSVAVFRNRQLFFSNEFGIPYVRTDNTQRKRIKTNSSEGSNHNNKKQRAYYYY